MHKQSKIWYVLCTIAVYFFGCTPFNAPKNETWAGELIYFNPQKHTFDTIYSKLTMFQDSIVSFETPTGKVWQAKDFIDNQEIYETTPMSYDITVSNGERFKLMPLDSGNVRNKTIMDSIKYSYDTEDEN